MPINTTDTKTQKELSAILYRGIAFLYGALLLILFGSTVKFLYTAINAPFTITDADVGSDIPRVNNEQLERVLRKIGGQSALMK